MRTLILFGCMLLALAQAGQSASVIVQWSSERALWGLVGPLSAGSPVDGDGALLQLGYFSEANTVNPFAGTWTVLAVGSIGDQGSLADGYFSITTTLEEGTFVPPAVGTQLGVRFFNGPTTDSSSRYNTAVNYDGTGLWQAPGVPAPAINLVLAKGHSFFESHSFTFQTSIPVPEPSMLWLGGLGAGFVLLRRNRIHPESLRVRTSCR